MRSRGLRVIPKLRALGSIALPHAAFHLGWMIGEGINAKVLKIGVPADPASDGDGFFPDWMSDQRKLAFRSEGEYLGYLTGNDSIYGNPRPEPLQPEDGWTLVETSSNQGWTFSAPTGGPNPGCWGFYDRSATYEGFSTSLGGFQRCFNGYSQPSTEFQYLGLYKAEDSLKSAGPVEDYNGQPYDRQTPNWPDKPQTQTELETRTQIALATGDYQRAELWYAHLLDPNNYPDPTTTENDNHRCDVSKPSYKNPGGSTTPTPHTAKLAQPLPTSGRPTGAANAPDPYLRWGTADWRGTYIDNWGGWGWRHIHAKHGWAEADESATRAALSTPAYTEQQSSTAMRYFGPQHEQNGAKCRRRVVVEYGVDPDVDPSETPKGIITSFGDYMGEAP